VIFIFAAHDHTFLRRVEFEPGIQPERSKSQMITVEATLRRVKMTPETPAWGTVAQVPHFH